MKPNVFFLTFTIITCHVIAPSLSLLVFYGKILARF
nr:MAG TPA: hypothetical protein [Caudoviricetes sp.]